MITGRLLFALLRSGDGTMEQEVQSQLLRLSILLATSLSTLSEPVAPSIVGDATSAAPSQSAADLSKQIIGDLRTLITSVQTSCTNLTLALKPNTKTTTSPTSSASPIAGLDAASLEAAKAQIVSITNDSVPKLVFLARKAVCEATVYRYVAKTTDDLAREKAELAFVKSKGGHVVQPAHARETEKLETIKGRGLGKAWSKSIVATVFELFEALGELSRAYMDTRTRTVLQKAQEARNKADGHVNGSNKVSTDDISSDPKKARQVALQATGVVWQLCDDALKGKSRLVADNRSAVATSWKRRTDVLKDALREFNEALEEEDEEGNASKNQQEDDEDALDELEDMQLTGDEKEQARKYAPLLKSCCQLHVKVGTAYLSSSKLVPSQVDLDELDVAGDAISEAVDDLVAALLYGGNFDGEDDDEKEGKAEDEAGEAVEQIVEACRRLHGEAVVDADATIRNDLDQQWATLEKTARELGYIGGDKET